MAQVGETEVVAGNVRDIVNRLSRDMTNRNPFSVHQQVERRTTSAPFSQPQYPLYIATFPYTATQIDELSFTVGDIIELISDVEDGWSKGRLKSTSAIGMFPTNFVKSVTSSTNTASSTPSTSSSRPKASEVVMRSEPKAIERTPSTIISDQISLPNQPKIVPVASTHTATSVEATSDIKTKEMARVKFQYNPQHDDELALAEVDVLINITSKNCGDAGWFEGELHGKKGLFPDNFVELVQVPLKTESGAKYPISRQATLVSHRPPPVNPPQPAVPPKPAKIISADSSISPTSTVPASTAAPSTMPSITPSSTPNRNHFAALREKMSTNLKVVAPEQVSSVQLKLAEQRDRASSVEVAAGGDTSVDANGSGDQVSELQHITKNRARPPKSRPMSMVMNRNRSSDESPSGRLSSPTSAASTNPMSTPMSTSMFIPAAAKEILIPSNSTAPPFKSAITPAPIVPPSSATKPALRPIASTSLPETSDPVIRKLASPDSQKSADLPTSSDFVSRVEYDALLDRFRALESRVLALEKSRNL
ncbi:unnamed protein product [Caenorhabditis sp. 36 PRJEB53466]|nr:unnamed protein product [Caenorhabditis sp. 36 PRJEB53466]